MTQKHINTHIRINAPGYRHNHQCGWENEEDRRAFAVEVVSILGGLGFTLQNEGSGLISRLGACPTVERDKESLYLHPDDLSGWLADGSLAEIVEALKSANTCQVRFVDEYERKVDCTPAEYAAELAKHESVIRERWLERLITPSRRRVYVRRTTHVSTIDLVNPMTEVGNFQARNMLKAEFNKAKSSVTKPILDRLIAEGLVECITDLSTLEVYVRTRGKTELATMQRAARKAAKDGDSNGPFAQAS